MDNSIEEIEYRGHTIKIYLDDAPESPREWDNLGTMLCSHKRYNLGDEQIDDWYISHADSWEDALALYIWNEYFISATEGTVPDRAFFDKMYKVDAEDEWVYLEYEDVPNEEGMRLLWNWMVQNMAFLPLYMYDHSGITINTTGFSCLWDSRQVGYIYVAPDKIKKEYGEVTPDTIKKAENVLRKEAEIYDDYVTGAVYGYSIDDGDIGGCWGFYGYDFEKNGLLEAARDDINYYIANKIKEHCEEVKAWIKNRVPLDYRKPLTIGGAECM